MKIRSPWQISMSPRKVVLGFLAISTLWWAVSAVTVQRIVIIGDSTVCNYANNAYPQMGWGQALVHYFLPGTVTLLNHAIGGRSSRSFYEGGRWDLTKQELRSGDILLIQFGHNDRDYTKEERYTDTSAYKHYLGIYITESRALGAHPVLVTPVNMNTWTNATTVRRVFTERARGADYRGAMLRVADSLDVPLLDLELQSKLLMDTLGQSYLQRFHFLGLDVNEYPNFPNGISDGTHFQEMGALENARMVVAEIAKYNTHPILGNLSTARAPLHRIAVHTNYPTGGDTLTRTRYFPAGANITLKVRPGTGVFQHWVNEAGQVVSTERRHTFVQLDAASQWTAVFQQGTPVPISSAASSSSSSSSSSTAVPLSLRLEAESPCAGDGVAESIHLGFSGAGYFNLHNDSGTQVRFAVQVTTAQSLDFRVRFASGSANSRPMQLRTSRSDFADTLPFASTGAWNVWNEHSFPISLSPGRTVLELRSLSAEGGPNLDWIGFTGGDVFEAPCEDPVRALQPAWTGAQAKSLKRPRPAYYLNGVRAR